MDMAVGAAPFGEMPSQLEILRRVRTLAPHATEHVPDQHVVSQVLLKQFAEPWGLKCEHLLAGINLKHPEKRPAYGGPKRFGKWPDFVQYASDSAEKLWQETENKLHEPLEAIKRDGEVIKPAHENVIREMIALHLVRSIPTAALHQSSWLKFRAMARQHWLQRPADLQALHVGLFGYWTSDLDRLELALNTYMQEPEHLVKSGALFRVSLEDRFERIRIGFQAFDLKILTAQEREFLIGDVPVLMMREGHGGLGFFDGVGIGNADEIVMPLTPYHVAVLGQGSESREATDDEVDHYNTLQVRIAYRHVYFRPGSGLTGFVRSVLGTKAA